MDSILQAVIGLSVVLVIFFAIYYATKENVSTHQCVGNYFGKIHYHPNEICIASEKDKIAWTNDSKNIVNGITCGQNRYTLYNYMDYNNSIQIINNEKDITILGSNVCPNNMYYYKNECCKGTWCGDVCYADCEEGIFMCVEGSGSCCDGIVCGGVCYSDCEEGIFRCENDRGICE